MLKFYDENQVDIKDIVGYLATSHNGTLGSNYQVKLYIRNDDSDKYYTAVTIQGQDSYGASDLEGPAGSGWGIKFSKGSRQPTLNEWVNVAFNNTLTMDNIGTTDLADTSTYYPFWISFTSPGNISAQIKTDVSLVLSATAHLIGT